MASSGSSGGGLPAPQCGCCEDCQQGGESASDAGGGADPTTGGVTGRGGGAVPRLGQEVGVGGFAATNPGGGGGGGGLPGSPGGGGGGFGMELVQHLIYSNLGEGNGPYGANWSAPSLPRLLFSAGDVLVERGGRKSIGFRGDGAGGYTSEYYVRDTLEEDATTGEFTLTDTSGGQQLFDSAGLLQEAKDPLGHVVSYSYSSGLLDSVEVTGAGSQSVEYVYSYDGSDRVYRVTLKVDGSSVRRVRYYYYSGSDNLKRAVLQRYTGSSWEELETSYYGYHGSNDGLLKYVLGHEAYDRYLSAGGGAQLEDYADFEYAYYGSGDPDGEEGQVKDVYTHGRAYHYAFVYASSASSGGDTNTWTGKTEVTQPDGHTVHTYYYNSGRQLMLKVVTDLNDNTFEHFALYQEFDQDGRSVLRAEPSAIDATSFDEAKSWLVDLKPAAGLVHVSEYYDGVSPAGQPAGYLHYTAVRKGGNGSDVRLREYTYEAQTVGGLTVQRRKTEKVYREATDTAASDPATTTYSYTYHQSGGSDTFQVEKKTAQLPAVGGDENGDGVAHQTEHHYDEYGFLEKYVDELGTETEYEYDLSSGGLTRVTRDAAGADPLVTDLECDALGRTTQVKEPAHTVSLAGTATEVRRTTWVQYLDADHEVRRVRGYTETSGPTEHTVNPVAISIGYAEAPGLTGFSMTEEIEAVYSGSGVPAETHSFAQSSYRSLSQRISNQGGELVRERLYHDIPSSGAGSVDTNYAETLYGYDSNGRRDTVTEPGGTIFKTVYDRLDRPEDEEVGTDDSGGGSDNMVAVSSNGYDDDGNLTSRTLYPEGTPTADVDRVTEYTYDWRGRATEKEWDDEMGTASRTLIVASTYDNRGNVTETVEYEGSVATANRINRAKASFDARDRLYRTERYGIDGSSEDPAQVSERYYDGKGNLLRDEPAGKVGYTVTDYDALSRPEVVYRAYGGPGPSSSGGSIDAGDISGATVVEQTAYAYDDGGNLVQTTSRARFDDATGTGELGDPSSTTEPKARVSYAGTYPDAVGRAQAVADVGTNPVSGTPTAWSRPAAVPARSDEVLVTSFEYDDAGRLQDTTDPAGTVERREYDDAGRLAKRVENYQAGGGSSSSGAGQDSNVTTLYEYTSDGNLTQLTALNASTGSQVTRWVYGVDQATGPAVARNDLVALKAYPDGATTGTDNVTFKYNVLGEVTELEDQNETVHEYDRDRAGRVRADRVADVAAGGGIDQSVLRLEWEYEARGMLALATSYNAETGGSVLNQVELAYNSYSQLVKDRQEHSGAVGGSTPEVLYGYFDGSANTVRRRRVRYPSLGSGWSYNYRYNAGADDALSRVSSVRLANGSVRLVSYRYLGLSTAVGVEYEQANSTELTYEDGGTGDAGDKYTGLDRFGRLVETVWKASSTEKLHSSYGRNRVGGAVWRRDDLAHAQGTPVETEDQYYWYDGLYRVEQRQRGDLAGTAPDYTGIVAGTRQQDEDYLYDATGNWLSYSRESPANSQDREHNAANEVTEIETVVGGSPSTIGLDPGGYDAAGNMVELPSDPAAGTGLYDVTWDAWNRPVGIADGGATLGVYPYDALHRRVAAEAGGDTRHFYYDDRWRPVEEHLDTGSGPALEREYCWGVRDRWDLARRRRDTGTSIDDEERYVLRDYLDPYATVDGNGAVQMRFGYGAFGRHRVMDSGWSAASNTEDWTWLFHGEFLDAATGLYNYGYRYYSPILGRWLSRDPLGEGSFEERAALLTTLHDRDSARSVEGEANLYAFVANEGANKQDNLGLREAEMGESHVSANEHDNFIEFIASCDVNCRVQEDSIEIDYSGVEACLRTHIQRQYYSSSNFGISRNWEPPASLGGLRDVANINCDAEDTTIEAFMRTRLVAPGILVSLWRNAEKAPSTQFSLDCYEETTVTYECEEC